MTETVLVLDAIPDHLIASLESRDLALWIRKLPTAELSTELVVAFLGLPWRLVICEDYDAELIKALESSGSFDDPMTRKRGFVQIIDSDPSRIDLPQRCLPIYLLNGRHRGSPSSDFEGRLRRMTMLENLRRSPVRETLVLSDDLAVVPPDLVDLWNSGLRTRTTFVSSSSDALQSLETWLRQAGSSAANLTPTSTGNVVEDILRRYEATYPETRLVVPTRDQHGGIHKVDVTDADDPERPILEHYSLIEDRNLAPILPEELSEADFVGFFQNPESSWRPYAAGLPWIRDHQCAQRLQEQLRRLDVVGSEATCITYISSEPGAGGTTLARALAWRFARDGYPTLVAKSLSFTPDALPIVNFLNRVHARSRPPQPGPTETRKEARHNGNAGESTSRLYEAPWLIVFDSTHWQQRAGDLVAFRRELERSGRPVCVLLVTGPLLSLPFYNASVFKEIAILNHSIDQNEARELGQHLNKFLRLYGKERQLWQWEQFYEDHSVRYVEGVAAFWVTLSFWIQKQYDLSESIQEWMYRSFNERTDNDDVRGAILEIAAMSSERFPLPEVLLPKTKGQWPVAHLLDDARSELASLGLTRLTANGEKYWGLVHDILGRFLLNALFYDFSTRSRLGLAEARDPDHLRFLVLRQISRKPVLGEKAYRTLGEDFATTIFKIDPDHGRGTFTTYWRDVLASLDSMSQSLRDTSRVFRHHVSVSRRRVAKLSEDYYGVTLSDRIALLTTAVSDIKYALNFIDFTAGSESNLNLFNSLANAYLDLAGAEEENNSPVERITELRTLANEATRRAYGENPMNSHVIETYVKNLLQQGQNSNEAAVDNCIEALGVLFSALAANETAYRASQLANLADQALALLFSRSPAGRGQSELRTVTDVLSEAWKTLAAFREPGKDFSLADVPEQSRARALEVLAHPAGKGNIQVIRLTYDILCIDQPHAFARQLELVEQLQTKDFRQNAQLRLEYAILLFQMERPAEGDKLFRGLRRLWTESEQFVQVPARLRWLLAVDSGARRTVHAITASDHAQRAMARVQEFANALVPFRPEEHGLREFKPGVRFAGHVSFGHNGPFLRPGTMPTTGAVGG